MNFEQGPPSIPLLFFFTFFYKHPPTYPTRTHTHTHTPPPTHTHTQHAGVHAPSSSKKQAKSVADPQLDSYQRKTLDSDPLNKLYVSGFNPPPFLQNKITKFCSERILLFRTLRYYSNFLSKGCTYKYIKQNSFYGLLHQRSGSGSAADVRPGLGSESGSA